MSRKKTPPAKWGGKRIGAGRTPATKVRCACGKHTLSRAMRLRLKCRQKKANTRNSTANSKGKL